MGLHVEALHTARLTLTPLMAADSDAMVAVYADPAMYTYTGGTPPTGTELRDRYERLAQGWNHDHSEQWCNWIVRVSGRTEPIGAMQASIADDPTSAAVAWEVAVRQQGNGFASEAATAVVEWLIARGVAAITATIHPEHAASAAIARNAGMTATDEIDDDEVVWKLLVSPA